MRRQRATIAGLVCTALLVAGAQAQEGALSDEATPRIWTIEGSDVGSPASAPEADWTVAPRGGADLRRLGQAVEKDASSGGQDRETQALDSTATQWSFQFAYQVMDYKDDMVGGAPRPTGNDNFFQVRIVAPIPKSEKIPFTLLPRLTFRHYEAPTGESGLGSTELFVLGIAKDWGTGRWGLGPLVEIPGSVGPTKLGYGLAGAIVNSTGKWFYGLLLTQAWRDIDPSLNNSGAGPLGIAPFLNYRIAKGWYVGNGDMVVRYDWDSSSVYMPIGVRLGKVLVGAKSSWNFYVEYQTSLVYSDWPGSAIDNSVRVNVTYTLPVGI